MDCDFYEVDDTGGIGRSFNILILPIEKPLKESDNASTVIQKSEVDKNYKIGFKKKVIEILLILFNDLETVFTD